VEVAKLPTAVLLLLHVPPAGVEFSVVLSPTHTFSEPVIIVGFGLIVTVALTWQPVAVNEAVIISVVLPVTPVTVVVDPPVVVYVALPLLAVQVMPALVVLKVVFKPTHTASTP